VSAGCAPHPSGGGGGATIGGFMWTSEGTHHFTESGQPVGAGLLDISGYTC
jgi:hypothetical protein